MRRLLWLVGFGLTAVAAAGEQAAASRLQVGDCVLYREGGDGLVLITPVYWLRGTVVSVVDEQRLAGTCPHIGKPLLAYSPADHARLAAAMPCVSDGGPPVEVRFARVGVAVDDWETPWSSQQGATGWLFRGRFLEQALAKGKVIEINANRLTTCGRDQ